MGFHWGWSSYFTFRIVRGKGGQITGLSHEKVRGAASDLTGDIGKVRDLFNKLPSDMFR
jgi:hypothetical protein